ncbi:MAG TPA: CDP-alcohol phosphatidyltransferase family protein [Methyloceanibacter sp.]|nr:CDP-alcohol phosphatidyltransferase family protein [Methyloceanibacter sp.]
MIARLGAASVHLLTATGAVFALLALRAASADDWQTMFVWLVIALFVDAIDGPLARLLNVKTVLPRFSGERLDLIVDYLTYVVVPAFALTEASLLPEGARLPAAIAILLSSLFHAADFNSKTEEGYFVGFPAIWNIVLLYLFALQLGPFFSLAIVGFFVLLTFVPLLAVHPLRVARLRPLTVLATLLWAGAASAAVANPFPSPLWVQALLLLTAAYFTGVGLYRWLR